MSTRKFAIVDADGFVRGMVASNVDQGPDSVEVDASFEMPKDGPSKHHRYHFGKKEWIDPRPQAQIDEDDVQDVRATRARAYPPVEEQLDMLWKAMDSNKTPRSEPFYSTIKAVKDKHKKPGK